MKKLVYLISPNKIDQNFFASLDKVLSFKNVKFFQLRIKNLSQKKLLNLSKRIIKITIKHKVKFIINDNIILASPGGKKMMRELDLIDVWFDSGSMPYAQLHYPFENKSIFEKQFPA